MKLGFAQSLFVAAIRTVVQLLILGLVLQPVFSSQYLWAILLVIFCMNTLGARETYATTIRYYPRLFVDCWVSIVVASCSTTAFAIFLIIKTDPWYEPQYIIPLVGMLLGNTVKGIQLAIDSAAQACTEKRVNLESYLSRGASKWEAARPVMRDAIRCGMTPCINQMAIIGLVSIPGMMTGNIISGTNPLLAAKYQMVIMFLISAATAIGVLVALFLLMNVIFDAQGRLTVQRLIKRTSKSADIVTAFFFAIWNALKWCGACCFNCCCGKKEKEGRLLADDGGVN